jgi:hypothetical protein
MTPYNFGRVMRLKVGFEVPNKPPLRNPALPPQPGSPSLPAPATPPRRLTMKDLPPDKPDRNSDFFGPAGYVNTAARWYHPGTTQTVTDPTEKAMMRVGQIGGGIGAAATAGAAAVTAGAPALASTALSQLPAYFAGSGTAAAAGAGGAGAVGAAAANPRVQQMFPTFSNVASNAMQSTGNAMQFGSNVAGRINEVSNNAMARIQGLKADSFQNLPDTVRKGVQSYDKYIGAPIESVADSMGAGQVGNPLNGMTQLVGAGDPMGAVPNGISIPYSNAKTMLEAGGELLKNRGGFGGGPGQPVYAGMR